MALLKWIHLRKLVPLADLIGQLEKGGAGRRAPSCAGRRRHAAPRPSPSFAARPSFPPRTARAAATHGAQRPVRRAAGADAGRASPPAAAPDGPLPADFKDRFLGGAPAAEPHVLQPARRHGAADRGRRRAPGLHLRPGARDDAPAGGGAARWLESLAESVAGRKVAVTTARGALLPTLPAAAAADRWRSSAPRSRRLRPTRT